jgi:hypothetical protein
VWCEGDECYGDRPVITRSAHDQSKPYYFFPYFTEEKVRIKNFIARKTRRKREPRFLNAFKKHDARDRELHETRDIRRRYNVCCVFFGLSSWTANDASSLLCVDCLYRRLPCYNPTIPRLYLYASHRWITNSRLGIAAFFGSNNSVINNRKL